MGWREERFIYGAIERLQGLKINRIRLLLAGAMDTMLGEPVMTGENFTMMLRPWIGVLNRFGDRALGPCCTLR